MRLLAVAGDQHALIAGIRLGTPLGALAAREGWALRLRSFHDCTRADLGWAQAIVLQRGTTARAWRLMQGVRQRGGAVLYDIDDLLTAVPPHVSNHAVVQAQATWLRRCLQAADLVTVSTARLGRELVADVPLPACAVVPNHALPLGDLPLPPQAPGAPVTLVLASMELLAGDLLHPVLQALCTRHGDGLQLVAYGPPAAALQAAGLPVRVEALRPRAEFLAHVRAWPNPLAVIPLEDARFAACKSAIKWFDYGEAGVPVLCSAVSPYVDVVEDGRTGALVGNDAGTWLAALESAIDQPAWRQRVAAAARQQVRAAHALVHSVDAWQQAMAGAMQQRATADTVAAPWGWRVRDAVGGLAEGAVQGLRRINRARLARRQRNP